MADNEKTFLKEAEVVRNQIGSGNVGSGPDGKKPKKTAKEKKEK